MQYSSSLILPPLTVKWSGTEIGTSCDKSSKMNSKLHITEEFHVNTGNNVQVQYPEHNAAYKHVHHRLQYAATTETVTFKFTTDT